MTLKSTLKIPVIFWVLLSGFLLRLWSFNFGLPFLFHADEPVIVNHALAFGSGDLNPHFFNIPPLTSYLLFACYGIYYLIGFWAGLFTGPGDLLTLFLTDPSVFYLIARFVFGVFTGSLSVYVLYRCIKKNDQYETALIAAIFFAFNFLHARDSHYVYADIPLILTWIMCLDVLYKSVIKPEIIKYSFYFGLLAGTAAAFKYNGIFIYFACLPALFLKDGKILKRLKGMIIAGISSVTTFFLLNPFAILDHKFFLQELHEQAAANLGVGWTHHLFYSLPEAMGWPLLVVSLAGIAAAFSPLRKRNNRLFAASTAFFCCAYYVVLVYRGQSYGRYVLPLMPFLCFLAADFLSELKLAERFGIKVLVPVLLLLAAIPGYKIIAWDMLMSKPDTRIKAKNWIEQNIAAESRLALDWDFYMPRLSFTDNQLNEKLVKAGAEANAGDIQAKRINILKNLNQNRKSYHLNYLSLNPDEPRFLFAEPVIAAHYDSLRKNSIDYVIIADTYRENDFLYFIEDLRNKAEKVMKFTPYHSTAQLQLDKQPLTGGPFLLREIAKRKSNGPIIEIYKVKQNDEV